MKFPQSFLIMLILLMVSKVNAQEELKHRDFAMVRQTLTVKEYQGLNFKLSADLRKEGGNGNEVQYLWVSISKKDEEDRYFMNEMMPETMTKSWNNHTVSGTIPENGEEMGLGFFVRNNGDFYVDNFKFEVQNKDATWKEVTLTDPSFEKATNNEIWNIENQKKYIEIDKSILNKDATHGSKSLHIGISGIYGQNDDKGGFVEVNNVKIYYEIYGDGEPLLLLHGSGQSIKAFQNQISAFAKAYKVIAVDSRGRGRSTDADSELTYMNQAVDMKQFLEALSIDKAHVVGWSDGGIIGLIMAMKYPDKVNKLVAMGANIHPDGLFPARLESHKENLKKMEAADNPDLAIYIKLYKLLINYPQLKYEDLAVIQSPCLIMAGDHDVIQDIHTVKMYQAIPNAALAILPNETHWFPEANAPLFNKMVLEFLSTPFETPKRY